MQFKKIPFFFLFLILSFAIQAQYSKKELRKWMRTPIDTNTSYVYQLPYKQGKNIFIGQGYLGNFSHRNRYALDFKIKRGDTIYAARPGIVVRAQKTGKKGGWNKKYKSDGNFVVIAHEDSSRAGYWHFQYNTVLVNIGDTVKQGQPIGLCGSTGYAMGAHLHFLVWKYNNGYWQGLITPFRTSKGIKYLRAWRRYRY
jgi:murein DD-endopeptidase MepM/ murein hydrolase activator NlpD